MTIGIDASRANLFHKTGTEWYSFYLIKNLAILDRQNKYVLYLNKPPRSELIAAIGNNPNFTCQVLNWPFLSFWTLGRLSWEMLWRRPDVLFVPAHGLPLFHPRQTINTIHDVAFLREENLYRSIKVKTDTRGARPLINFLVRFLTLGRYRSDSVDYLHWSTAFALKHARRIIAISEFTKQDILSLYPKTKPAKITVIHNGFNDELYRPIDESERRRAVLAKYDLKIPYFLYVGRLEKKKNTPTLVEAFALFREARPDLDAKLVLIGDAGFGYDEVKYAIEEFDLNDQVYLLGWIPEEELPDIFSAASAFIFPSKYEGFGITVLQALACGVPTAVSDLPVLHEVAGEAALYFDQNDKHRISEAMLRIMSDEDLRSELRARGRQRAAEFSWRRCAEQTLELLKSL